MESKRVLLVDDNDRFCRALSRVLRRAGYQVSTASNGTSAIENFSRTPSDLVIMDLIMPEKEGLETITELLRIQPKLKIVAISGGGCAGDDTYLQFARKLGATETLAKPFSLREILDILTRFLGAPTQVGDLHSLRAVPEA